jgi:hypothetical protein
MVEVDRHNSCRYGMYRDVTMLCSAEESSLGFGLFWMSCPVPLRRADVGVELKMKAARRLGT